MDDGSMICIIPVLIVAGCIALYIYSTVISGKRLAAAKQALQDQMQRIRGFSPSQFVISINGKTALGVDEQRNLLALLIYQHDIGASYRVISAAELISAEVFAGGKSSSQVRNKAITGALVGSIFGGAGAIIGANIAGSKAAGDVDKVSLILTVNDTQNPHHQIDFATPGYKNYQAEQQAKHWMAIMEILVRRAESGQIAPVYHSEALDSPQESGRVKEYPALPSPHPDDKTIPACELRSAAVPHSSPIRVDQANFTIGRAATNDLILQDPAISRQHAVLRFLNHAWVVQDQNSTAGVYVNGNRVREKHLNNGDQIKIGSAVFIFRTKE